MTRTVALGLWFLACPAFAEGALILLPSIGATSQVTVSGRTLRAAPAASHHTLTRNLKSLLAKNQEGVEVEVRFQGRTRTVTSGHDGDFQATFDAPDGGFPVGVQTFEAKTASTQTSSTAEVVSPLAPFLVISDFDDTLAVTHVVDKKGLVTAALLEDEKTQPVVPGMNAFYGCLRDARPTAAAFALVSGSPIQYQSRIEGFLTQHGFPRFALLLRDLGPNTLSNYKQPLIRGLLKALPHPVVLVGDSGEHDPEVYAEIRAEAPARVLAIYIRDAGHAEDAKRFPGMLLFKQAREAALDAVKKGLATKACVDLAFGTGGHP